MCTTREALNARSRILAAASTATAIAITIGIAGIARTADARPPYDPAVDVELFQLPIGPEPFFTVAGGDGADRGQLTATAAYTYTADPFRLSSPNVNVVQNLTEAQLSAAYGILDRLQVGFALPIILALDGDALDPHTGEPEVGGLDVHGIGDLRLELAARLYRGHQLRIALAAGGTIATSNGTENAQFTGDDTASYRGHLAVQWDHGRLGLGANVGGIIRTARDVYGVDVGDALTWGVAASVRITERVSVIGEGFGQAGLTAADSGQSPVELAAGLRVFATPSVSVAVGGGAGIDRSLGAPTAQFFLIAGYTQDDRDTDGDGIPNSRDRCPLEPEDFDGFQDADGCPDLDNDGDGIPDATDKCPNEPEDHDGFQDEDGCPDLDNDKDGIPDAEDKCPNDAEDGLPPLPHDGCPASMSDADGDGIPDSIDKCPLEEEDKDGYEDADGCPDPDNDGDGIPDALDKCPMCPEDLDGFQDADGCPELDNDNDGIPDALDKCPNEPETVNGIQDDDGCPDTGGITVVRLDGDVLVVDKPPSLGAGGALSREGQLIVGEMSLVMAGHHEVSRWVVAVAQPTAAAAHQLSAAITKGLARWVTVEVKVLEAVGPAKVAGAVDQRVDPNVFVCPAGLEVHGR